MAAQVWSAWGEEWALGEKVSFNGVTKRITVNAGVTSLNIRDDVYSAWVRWLERETNSQYLPAMRYSGGDPIPGGETGVTFFVTNNWKFVYDPNVVAVSGVLYSDNYATAYWSASDQPLYPATVSSLVNSAVVTQNVVTGTALTEAQTAAAVWQAAQRTLSASLDPTKEQIAAQVRAALADELTRILEIAKLHGLIDPLVVSQGQRSAGTLLQTISTAPDGTTTVTRQ